MPKQYYPKNGGKSKHNHKQAKTKDRRPVYISVYQPKVVSTPQETKTTAQINTTKIHNKIESVDSKKNYEEEKTCEVLITDFKFSPQHLTVTTNSVVCWKVDKNETIHDSGVYEREERSFVVLIYDSEIVESDLLSKNETFSYKFKKPGIYQIECANYREIQGSIEVCDNLENRLIRNQPELPKLIERATSPPRKKNLKENRTPEVKNSLLLIKDFENDNIKGLILELSLKSASDKGIRDLNLSGDDEIIEDFETSSSGEHHKRYDKAANNLKNQAEVNIYESLVSREFNGINIRSRDQSSQSEKSSDKEGNSFYQRKPGRTLSEQRRDKAYLAEEKLIVFDSLNLPSLKNPKDEEQKFVVASNCDQEIHEITLKTADEETGKPQEDKFFAFLKEEVKTPVSKMRKKASKNKNENKSNNKVPHQEIERVSALKAFLTNRFEFAEIVNGR